MTIKELKEKYSEIDINSIPIDSKLRRKIFTPIFSNLTGFKIVYYDKFMCVASVQEIEITPVSFSATVIPYLKIEQAGTINKYYPTAPYKFGANWIYLRLDKNCLSAFGNNWKIWTDPDIVQLVEEYIRNGEFEKALEITLFEK